MHVHSHQFNPCGYIVMCVTRFTIDTVTTLIINNRG